MKQTIKQPNPKNSKLNQPIKITKIPANKQTKPKNYTNPKNKMQKNLQTQMTKKNLRELFVKTVVVSDTK